MKLTTTKWIYFPEPATIDHIFYFSVKNNIPVEFDNGGAKFKLIEIEYNL